MSLDRYKIDKVIGKGSYGEVSLVKHKKDKKQVSRVIEAALVNEGFPSIHYLTLTLQYVMKKVDLSKASDKERKAAEQEVKQIICKTFVYLTMDHFMNYPLPPPHPTSSIEGFLNTLPFRKGKVKVPTYKISPSDKKDYFIEGSKELPGLFRRKSDVLLLLRIASSGSCR